MRRLSSTDRAAPVATEYKVVGLTDPSDPGNGCMRFNTAAQGDATQLYFDQLATGNVDQTATFTALQPGDRIDVQQKDAASVVGAYSVAAVTNNTGWYTIDVTAIDSAGMPIPGNKGANVTFTYASDAPTNLVTAIISAGDNLSSSIDLTGSALALILAPVGLEGGPHGRVNLSFQVSADNNTFFNLIDEKAAEVQRTVIGGCATPLPTSVTQAAMYAKIRTGPADNPIDQSEDRVFILILA
jgi:hypothetical protein